MKRFLKKFSLILLSLFMVFSNTYFISAGETLSYQTISNYEVPSGIVSATTSETYSWTTYQGTQTLISGNAHQSSSVSAIKFTIQGSGAFCFDYRVYSLDLEGETNPDSLVVSIGTEITTSTTYTTLVNDGALRYYGETGWQSCVLKITAEDTETTDIYIAYKKNGSKDHETDCALIKNITFNTSEATITANVSDATLGSVTGAGTYYAGENVTLTATPTDIGKFYGWAVNNQRVEESSPTYTFLAGVDITVTAIFGNKNSASCWNRRTGAVYSSLATAFANALENDVIELLEDTTMTEDATIPQGVTLYIPYSETYDEDGNADGTTENSRYFATSEQTYRHLTISNGVTLTVQGELLIGGVISYPAQYYQGHTSGAHGRITCNGTVLVNGGQLDCYGFIDGTGIVKSTSGFVYEPFIVLDFAGGNNCLNLYLAGQNSFTEYTMQNISCTLQIEGTGVLGAYCNLYASSQYNKIKYTNTDGKAIYPVFIGNSTDYPDALIAFNEGASVTRTVDKTKTIPAGILPNDSKYGADIGQTNYTVSGGASLGNLQMVVLDFDISVDKFPIPYCFTATLENGDYQIKKGWNIMPGASLTVSETANLTVSGSLYVLDGLVNKGMSGKYYPSTEKLLANNFSPSGVFIVNGKVTFKSGSTFGGIIQSTKTGATIVVEDGTNVENTSVQFGATACYDDNTCVMTLNGRVQTADGLVTLQTNKTYKCTATTTWTLPSYTVTEYADHTVTSIPSSGKYVGIPNYKTGNTYSQYKAYAGPLTVTLNETMQGIFALDGDGIEITYHITNKTYYDATNSSITTVSTPSYLDRVAKFKVSFAEDVSGYAYLVKVSVDGTTYQIVTPNADGDYCITNPPSEVFIEVISVKIGDVDLDGDITAADVTKLRRSLAGYSTITEEFSLLSADTDSDGDITAADVTRLRRYLAGYIASL